MMPSNIHLMIAADILSNQNYNVLKNLTRALKPGCFILLEESTAMLHLSFMCETDLMLIAKQTTSVGKTYLLLRKKGDKANRIIVHVTEKNLSWLDDVKAALSESDRKGHEVLLVSQREELFGIVIRKKFVVIPLLTQFYADQLNKGLRANILKEGCWGSYRHLQFKPSNVQTEYAYVNALTKGNLNSLTWIQSPSSHTGQPSSSLNTTQCNVYYAPINNR